MGWGRVSAAGPIAKLPEIVEGRFAAEGGGKGSCEVVQLDGHMINGGQGAGNGLKGPIEGGGADDNKAGDGLGIVAGRFRRKGVGPGREQQLVATVKSGHSGH